MSLTCTDVFSGAGGESIGLHEAGIDITLAANHWDVAIATHAANFTDTDHLCADVSNYDMRRLPYTDIAWFSPECTWHSPAGGRKAMRAQLDLYDDYVSDAAGERSRATMLDVFRATEARRYKIVVVENVVEVVTRWPSFDWWVSGLKGLGYHVHIVCVNSAHIGDDENLRAPQWRDRIYIVLTRDDIKPFTPVPRPEARCFECDEDVLAVQSWKDPRKRPVGKYGQQYVYRCPNSRCRHSIVEPYVRPGMAAIDLNDLGTRIGDRPRPLAANTLRRIQWGLDNFCQPTVVAAAGNTFEAGTYRRAQPAYEAPLMTRTGTSQDGIATPPMVVTLNHGGHQGRQFDPTVDALPTRSSKIGEALVTPFIAELRGGGSKARPVTDPLATLAAHGNHHGLLTPFIVKQYGGNAKPQHLSKRLTEPLSTITTKDHNWLVIPWRRGARAYPAKGAPLSTIATREQHSVLVPGIDIEDCFFRMLQPREHLAAQRFPGSYLMTGNKSEQTCQAGNAVSSNVARWFGDGIVAHLDAA